MKPEVKSIDSPDVDLELFYPTEEDNFGFYLEVMIGPEGEASEEFFGIQVGTAKWLQSRHTEIVLIQKMLLVVDYDLDTIFKRIGKICDSASAESWSEVSKNLSKSFDWEFE